MPGLRAREKRLAKSPSRESVSIFLTPLAPVNKEHGSPFRGADCGADCLNEPCVQLGTAKCGQRDRYRSVNKCEFATQAELQNVFFCCLVSSECNQS